MIIPTPQNFNRIPIIIKFIRNTVWDIELFKSLR